MKKLIALSVILATSLITAYGGEGNDLLRAYSGNNYLIGGPGNDTLKVHYGVETINTFEGGTGNDILFSEHKANDRYLIKLGDGQDRIKDWNGQDTLVFGPGIKVSDLKFERLGSDLKIVILDSTGQASGQSILIHYGYALSRHKIESIELDDGSIIPVQTLLNDAGL